MDDFKKIKEELLPQLAEAEKLRKTHLRYKRVKDLFFLTFILGIFALPFLLYIGNAGFSTRMGKNTQNLSLFSVESIIIGFWVLFFLVYYLFSFHKNRYTKVGRQIVTDMLKRIAPVLTFNARSQITAEEISDSKLFPSYYQVSYGNGSNRKFYNQNFGIFSGKIGAISVSMGDVKIINQSFFGSLYMHIPLVPHFYMAYNYIRPWFSKNHAVDNAAYSFSGMVAIVDFNKKFSGTTVVLPDRVEKRMGYLAKIVQSLNFSRDQLVNLENPEFEKEFVVYGTDQVEARYLLSPLLMQRITELQRKVNRSLMLSFSANKLYVAIQHPYGFFSLPEHKNLVDTDALEVFHQDVSTAIGIVEDLNLNTKIWG